MTKIPIRLNYPYQWNFLDFLFMKHILLVSYYLTIYIFIVFVTLVQLFS